MQNLRTSSVCIVTKLDECAALGGLIGALCQFDVPLLYTAAGQEIPDDIALASGSELIAKAVKLARSPERAQTHLQGA